MNREVRSVPDVQPGEKRTYKAYGPHGDLRLHSWAKSSAAISAEEAAFQARLDRGELLSVDVISTESQTPNFTMYAGGLRK